MRRENIYKGTARLVCCRCCRRRRRRRYRGKTNKWESVRSLPAAAAAEEEEEAQQLYRSTVCSAHQSTLRNKSTTLHYTLLLIVWADNLICSGGGGGGGNGRTVRAVKYGTRSSKKSPFWSRDVAYCTTWLCTRCAHPWFHPLFPHPPHLIPARLYSSSSSYVLKGEI